MRNRVKQTSVETGANGECAHYWLIDAAEGPTSHGVCKLCGVKMEFRNSWIDSTYAGRDARIFQMPDLLAEDKEPAESQ
jgi:hypothetical protein